MRLAPLIAALVLTTPCWLGSSTANAQETAEDKAAELGRQGLELFTQGRFPEALLSFESAEKLASTPVFGLYIARSLRNAGRLVEAQSRYERVIATPLASDAPEPFQTAKVDAEKELAQLKPRIPQASFDIVLADATPSPDSVTLVVDGRELPKGGPHDLDPGSHEVVASDASGERGRAKFELREGVKNARVSVTVTPGAGGAEDEKPSGATPGSLVPGLVFAGAGAASLLIGAITGGLAIGKESDLAAACPGGACPPERSDDLDEANALATTSTVTLIVGGALAATGVVLLILRPGGEDAPAATATALQFSAAPNGVWLQGTF